MLTSQQIVNTAAAFALFWRRRQGTVESAWAAWSGSKDFQPDDAQRIRTHAAEILSLRNNKPPPRAA